MKWITSYTKIYIDKLLIFIFRINLKFILFIQLLFYSSLSIYAQEYSTGLVIDSIQYSNSTIQAPLMRGDYDFLPKSASLLQYTPTPGNQGQYGTCAGWATAYSCRTILEAFYYKWNKTQIDSNAFSPSFVYNQIRLNDNCNGGTSLIDALDVLKEKGSLTLNDFAYECSKSVEETDLQKAINHRIIEYRMVASKRNKNQTQYVKKSLAENKPVILAMDVAPSFHRAKELWKPESSEYKDWSSGHAIGVIGYDDEKYGGAFQLINSWGTSWGKDGFTWMRYDDFNFFCLYAYELVDKERKDSNFPDLSGSILFRGINGDTMVTEYDGNYFLMKNSYPAGSLFELFISNNEPAYLYVFSSDLSNNFYKIFPFTNNMSAYLPYKQNNIAVPNEDSYNMLDNNPGKTYFCFLYSKEKLDIDELLEKLRNEEGSIYEKISRTFEDHLIEKQNINYGSDYSVEFSAFSRNKIILPVIIEFKHTN